MQRDLHLLADPTVSARDALQACQDYPGRANRGFLETGTAATTACASTNARCGHDRHLRQGQDRLNPAEEVTATTTKGKVTIYEQYNMINY